MFGTRLLSGIILVILALVLVGGGGEPLLLASLLISVRGCYELYRALRMEKSLMSVIGYISVFIYYALIFIRQEQYMMPLFIGSLMALMTVYVITFPDFKTEELTEVFFGIFYAAVMFSYIYKTRVMHDGRYLVWLIFLSSWGSDTFAYIVGMLIGKRKIAPALSPKKSLEGCIGGVIGAALLGYIFASFFGGRIEEIANPGLACAIACAIGSVISQLGDFSASAIKRNHDIKDYGRLIPGHGGILDRFDSVLFTAPAVYFAIRFWA